MGTVTARDVLDALKAAPGERRNAEQWLAWLVRPGASMRLLSGLQASISCREDAPRLHVQSSLPHRSSREVADRRCRQGTAWSYLKEILRTTDAAPCLPSRSIAIRYQGRLKKRVLMGLTQVGQDVVIQTVCAMISPMVSCSMRNRTRLLLTLRLLPCDVVGLDAIALVACRSSRPGRHAVQDILDISRDLHDYCQIVGQARGLDATGVRSCLGISFQGAYAESSRRSRLRQVSVRNSVFQSISHRTRVHHASDTGKSRSCGTVHGQVGLYVLYKAVIDCQWGHDVRVDSSMRQWAWNASSDTETEEERWSWFSIEGPTNSEATRLQSERGQLNTVIDAGPAVGRFKESPHRLLRGSLHYRCLTSLHQGSSFSLKSKTWFLQVDFHYLNSHLCNRWKDPRLGTILQCFRASSRRVRE
nr:hypothetical protein CFP56_37343 [Quercus suber]